MFVIFPNRIITYHLNPEIQAPKVENNVKTQLNKNVKKYSLSRLRSVRVKKSTHQLFTCSIVNPVSCANCFFWSSDGYGCCNKRETSQTLVIDTNSIGFGKRKRNKGLLLSHFLVRSSHNIFTNLTSNKCHETPLFKIPAYSIFKYH